MELTAGLYLAYGKKGTLPALLTGATGVGLYALYEHMLSTTHISNPNGQTMAQQVIMGQPGQPGQPGSDGTPGMPGIGGSGGAGGSAVGGIGGVGEQAVLEEVDIMNPLENQTIDPL